tara:strand:- start:54 stop:326 length:273 start_codon:yes stop_codon:yes gene_type:complete
MNLIKPKLVDYSLIKYPKKKPTIIQKKIVKQDNSKFYLNLFMVLILCIGGYTLYYRMQNKEKEKKELEQNIILLDKYVNDSLNIEEKNTE